jgi:anti-sigma factor ChrR (cupin superfamily)
VVTALMKFAPGAKLPDHEHMKIEQTWVFEGSLVCGEGECTAGNFVWRPPHSRHEAWAGKQGGLMLAIFQVPNKFYEPDGRETNVIGQDWNEAWSKALFA